MRRGRAILQAHKKGALVEHLRVGIKCACRELQHRRGDSLIMYCGQITRLRFE